MQCSEFQEYLLIIRGIEQVDVDPSHMRTLLATTRLRRPTIITSHSSLRQELTGNKVESTNGRNTTNLPRTWQLDYHQQSISFRFALRSQVILESILDGFDELPFPWHHRREPWRHHCNDPSFGSAWRLFSTLILKSEVCVLRMGLGKATEGQWQHEACNLSCLLSQSMRQWILGYERKVFEPLFVACLTPLLGYGMVPFPVLVLRRIGKRNRTLLLCNLCSEWIFRMQVGANVWNKLYLKVWLARRECQITDWHDTEDCITVKDASLVRWPLQGTQCCCFGSDLLSAVIVSIVPAASSCLCHYPRHGGRASIPGPKLWTSHIL